MTVSAVLTVICTDLIQAAELATTVPHAVTEMVCALVKLLVPHVLLATSVRR